MHLIPRILGQSELRITPVGVGTAPIGSTPNWRIYWGPQDEQQAIRAIEAAVDLGVNWIDTAPFYGWGRAEELVGKALRGKRTSVYLFTKCGTVRDERGEYENLTPQSIRREVEASLRRLQTDYLDLYQFHDPDPLTPMSTSWEAMQQLIREGKVRYAGLSNHSIDLMQQAMAIAPITSNQHQYSLLHRSIEQEILPFSKLHHIGVLAWSPLASGFLTDDFTLEKLDPQDFRQRHPYAQEPAWSRLRAIRTSLQAFAQDHHQTLVNLAIAWVLTNPSITGAIIGIRNEQEARTMMSGADWKLTAQEVQTIEHLVADWP